MANRRNIERFSKDGLVKYIIRKNWKGDEIHVVEFRADEEKSKSEVLVECIGQNGVVFEFDGNVVDDFATTGRSAWTLKDVVAFVDERIAERGIY